MLVDTGLRPEAAEDPVGSYGPLAEALLPNGYPRELAVDAQLEKLGVKPTDIDTVVQTHPHFDHTGAMGCSGTRSSSAAQVRCASRGGPTRRTCS